jgi:hypothetical protein
MKEMSLKINTYIKESNVINTNEIERVTLRFIFWSFGVLAILYLVFLGNMVRNIIARRTLDTAALSLSSEVGNLELTYLSLSNNIDLAYSYSIGFKDSKATFTTRKSLGIRSLDGVKIAQNGI